ncbi:ATP-dependent RNA helicase SUPV3L1, mitochondrial [Dendropsophus ebraccatus]|uniref:ATP-dependent RNA helicase SUPV3L1, mitochondrial n=1 Tax=Dendropsophus ebraccatus TaxID=150705 RepID=UPI00383117BB
MRWPAASAVLCGLPAMYIRRVSSLARCCLQARRLQSTAHRSNGVLSTVTGWPRMRSLSRPFSSDNGKPLDTSLFVPVEFKNTDSLESDIGAELTRPLNKSEVLNILNKFYRRKEIQKLAAENGLDARLFHQAFISFRRYVMESDPIQVDLHIVLNDICCGVGHMDDIFPFFMRHARQVFPVLDCLDDLRKISDLRLPPNWYPEARAIQRKIIFHAGPTNSGKTYHAIQRYLGAKSGIYCGPLKLLAHEIYKKSNEAGVPCDLITGEELIHVDPEGKPSAHAACTVEMCSMNTPYEVAVIDEIQMIRDPGRGWAWTRALLGICAQEIHLCGEAAAINLVTELMYTTGEEVEVRNYERLTSLKILDHALQSLDNLRPGDCIVCFNKNDIFSVSRQIEARGLECAVIYGSLPPGTKIAQANKFNDPDDPCKILVATDAIGMGLNLSIKRIIFNSLLKPSINDKGEKEIDTITTSQALQIAGRAGRFSSMFKEGEVTTMVLDDLPLLKEILNKPVHDIQTAGLHPTAEQIEMFAYHLPDATLANLIDIFVSLSQVDGRYFVCNIDDFKFVADMIQHIPLNLRARYVFCTAPINRNLPFVCTSLLKFARQFSRNEPLTFQWVCKHVSWPVSPPKTIKDLIHLEAVHDILDLYLWLSYRFMDMFPDAGLVRAIQRELDSIIQSGVHSITKLIRASEIRTALQIIDETSKDSESVLADAERPGPRRIRGAKPANSEPQKRSLTSRLVQDGLLTPDMLKQLEKEWMSRQHSRGSQAKSNELDILKKNRKKK